MQKREIQHICARYEIRLIYLKSRVALYYE